VTSWTDFETAEPDLAAQARTVIASTTNCVLGTIRADGSPRLSGIDPFFLGDHLWMGSMPNARKGADLQRDPRCSLHGIPWESRKVKEGAEAPGDTDVKVSARAVLLEDDAEQASVMAWFKEKGQEFPGGADLFRLDLDSVTTVSVADDMLVIRRWTPSDGLVEVRRS
jgi:hypothetical protein